VDVIRERRPGPRSDRRRRAFEPTPTARPWLDRGPGECQWPVGEPDIPMRQLSCCAPTEGAIYCALHLSLAGRGYSRLRADDEALLKWLERRKA
jgi:hypothetical protein